MFEAQAVRPLGHRRQVLLFLVAILVPCLVLVGLSVHMIGQEQELAEKRRTDERRHLLEQVRQELLARLELITLEEVDTLSKLGEVSRPASYRNPAVVFVGWMEGKKLVLYLGYAKPVEYAAPEGIQLAVDSPTRIVVSGIDRILVGEVANSIRSFRKPEPYKGKGIRYEGEYVRKKAGKAAVGSATG